MLRYKPIVSIFWAYLKKSTEAISEHEDKNILVSKSNIRVPCEFTLFCFSTLQLKYFAYLSLQSSVYN